jgi:hypothetical protein
VSLGVDIALGEGGHGTVQVVGNICCRFPRQRSPVVGAAVVAFA